MNEWMNEWMKDVSTVLIPTCDITKQDVSQKNTSKWPDSNMDTDANFL
jgi:hypothetical protein